MSQEAQPGNGPAVEDLVGNAFPRDRSSSRGAVITVFSSMGGCGKTTLATNLAAALAVPGREVCLVDLDLAFGDVAIAMQLFPTRTLSDAVPVADVLDHTLIRTLLTEHRPGLATLLAPIDPGAAEFIGADLVSATIRLLGEEFDYVVVDTPPAFDDRVLAVLHQSDIVALVGTPGKRALTNLRLTLDTLDLLQYPRERLRIVLNRAEGTGMRWGSEIETTLQIPVSAHIPSSRDVPASINRGVPIVQGDPEHPVSQAVKDFAERSARWISRRTGEPVQASTRGRRRLTVPSLAEKLAAHAQQAAAARGMTAHVAVHGPAPGASSAPERGLLRLAFDAIALACKHPNAHNLWVDIHLDWPLVIRIEDDGTGPVCKEGPSKRLRPLADLAAKIGAYLAVGPRVGQGTVLEITAA